MKVGDYVRINNPRHVGKGEVKYSKIMEVVKVNGSCVMLKDGRKWNMSRIVKCTTTNVPNQVEYQGNNCSGGGNHHHMQISYINNQQAVPVKTGPDISLDQIKSNQIKFYFVTHNTLLCTFHYKCCD